MNEEAIINLISHTARQILRENGAEWSERDEIRISEEIADAAWTALIVGARTILERGQPFILEGVGCFDVIEGKWQFDAAETLQNAKSLSLPLEGGQEFLANQVFYLLNKATQLISKVPADMACTKRTGLSSEQEPFDSLFGNETRTFGEITKGIISDINLHLTVAETFKSFNKSEYLPYVAKGAELQKSPGHQPRLKDY